MIAASLIKSEVEVERCVVYMKGGIITLALGWVCVLQEIVQFCTLSLFPSSFGDIFTSISRYFTCFTCLLAMQRLLLTCLVLHSSQSDTAAANYATGNQFSVIWPVAFAVTGAAAAADLSGHTLI